MPYTYSLIRFVPDPARGEFVNIGAIAGDDDSVDWGVRWIANYTRAKALDTLGFLPAAKAWSAELDAKVAELDDLTLQAEFLNVEWLQRLGADMNNIIQLSQPAPVAAASAEDALDVVFDRMLVDPARTSQRYRKKTQAQAATINAYRAHNVPDDAVKSHVLVASGSWSFDFDFAVHNGHAVQLVQCWSFELPNQDELREKVKAWAWMAHEIRRSGGRLTVADVDVPHNLDLGAVYIPPSQDSQAFNEARSAFDELEVTAASFDDVSMIGQRAASALGSAVATES
jgi:hypothetical protein